VPSLRLHWLDLYPSLASSSRLSRGSLSANFRITVAAESHCRKLRSGALPQYWGTDTAKVAQQSWTHMPLLVVNVRGNVNYCLQSGYGGVERAWVKSQRDRKRSCGFYSVTMRYRNNERHRNYRPLRKSAPNLMGRRAYQTVATGCVHLRLLLI